MEFDLPFKLQDGTELTITAEVTETETILGLTFPIGCRLSNCLFEAWGLVEEMEERAVERYRELRAASKESA